RRAPAGRRPAGPRVQPRPRRPPGDRGGHARTPRRARPRRDRGGARLSTGVVLMTYGAPDGAADLPRYLAAVRGGRPASDELVAEMARRYEVIGGPPVLAAPETPAPAPDPAVGARRPVRGGPPRTEPAWSAEPLFIESLARRVREALGDDREGAPIVLTAHSLPRRVFETDREYVAELRATGERVAAAAGLDGGRWRWAYQSA